MQEVGDRIEREERECSLGGGEEMSSWDPSFTP